jgi:hypothetical protein
MNVIDLEYLVEHGHVKVEDAQGFHSLVMRRAGITDPDEIVAEWNCRDPRAPWGSGIVGVYVEHVTELVWDYMRDSIETKEGKES